MSISLSDLREMVNRKLGNHLQWASATDTGDGSTTLFRLQHQNIVESSLVVSEDGVEADYGTLDAESGWYQFSTAPGDAVALVFTYSYRHWSDTQINEALNVGIEELFGNFYVNGTNDDIWSEGGAEFIAQTSAGVDLSPEDRVTKVEYWNGSRWVKMEGWHVMTQNATKVVIFENTPASGVNFRISYHSRPSLLSSDSDTLETTSGLPTRAREPITDYACAELLVARIAPGIRDDRANNTQNENRIKSYEVVNDSQFFRAQADRKASKLRMAPLKGRVAP